MKKWFKSLLIFNLILIFSIFITQVHAGPAYKKLVLSNPSVDTWQDGINISITTDIDQCKKVYGQKWANECSAPYAGKIGQEVEGIIMNPKPQGTWRWISADTMHFEPKKPLSPNTTYSISLENVQLPARFELNKKATYKTQPQAVNIGKETLWIDPSNKMKHVISIPVNFIWPINKNDIEKKITLSPMGSDSGLEFSDISFNWNETNDRLTITAPLTSLPRQNSSAILKINDIPFYNYDDGKRVINAQTRFAQSRMLITGSIELMNIEDMQVLNTYDDNLNKTYTLEITTNLQVKPIDILSHLDLFILPKKSSTNAGSDCNWIAMPAISADDIKASKKIEGKLLQPENEPSTTIKISLPTEEGRYLLAAVKPGLPSTSGLTLNRTKRFIKALPYFNAEINFLQFGNILSYNQNQRVDIHSIGVDNIKWRIEKVRDPFLALLASKSGFKTDNENEYSDKISFDNIAESKEGNIKINENTPGKPTFTALNIAELLSSKDDLYGVMNLVLEGYDKNNKRLCETSKLILFTNLGLFYKSAANGTATAFVRYLSSGKPAVDAEVAILGSNGQAILTAKTDNSGKAELPSTNGLTREKTPVAIIAKLIGNNGHDIAWLPLSDSSLIVDYSNFQVSGLHSTTDGLSASVFSQRGIYMPGETLHFGTIIRRFDWGKLPENLPIIAELYNPLDKRIFIKEFKLSQDGLFSFDYKSDEMCEVGTYRVDISIPNSNGKVILGSTSVRIEEFQPDTLAIKLNVEPKLPKGWIILDKKNEAKASIQLDNLYGDPAKNHKINANIHLSPNKLSFKGYEDYTFCDLSTTEGENQTIELPSVFTDNNGKAQIQLPLNEFRSGTSLGLIMVDGLELAGGRGVSKTMQVLFSPKNIVLGYKPEKNANNLEYIPQKSESSIKLIAVDNDLNKQNLNNLKAIFSARRYVNSLVSDARGYHYEATPVDTEIENKEISISDAGTNINLITDTVGDFLLSIRNDKGETLASIPYSIAGFKLANPETLSKDMLRHGSLRLKLDKTNYSSGDTIQISLSTPFDGTGLITIERENVVAHSWFNAKAGESIQSIKIPNDFEGRGYVNVSFVRAQDSQAIYINPHAFAVAPFMAGIKKRNMEISISVAENIKPGQKLNVKITANKSGKVQLFAVDEGVLQLTNFKTPDPLADLLTNRALDVTTHQAFNLLMPDHEILRGRIPGFGGGMGSSGGRFLNPFKRKNEPPFSYWSPILDIDKTAEVTLDIPEYFSGQIRIMAIGSALSDSILTVGNAEISTKVRGTLVLKPQLPLAVTPNDTFEGAIVIGNTIENSGKNLPIDLKLSLPKGLTLVNGKDNFTIQIDENSEKAITFRLKALENLGDANIKFIAKTKDLEIVRNQSLSIRPAGQFLRQESSSPVQQAQTPQSNIIIDTNRTLYPYKAKTRLSLATGPLLALRSILENLDSYPFTCTEQLISRAMPYVALFNAPKVRQQVLQSSKRTEEQQKQKGDFIIAQAINAIRQCIEYDGITAWPNADGGSKEFLTAYAGDFLLLMRENGMLAPEDLIGKILDIIERNVSRTPQGLEDVRYKLYGIWVLLRDGRIMTNALNGVEKWITGGNINHWENDIMAALMADNFAALRLNSKASKYLVPTKLQITTESIFSTGVARGLYVLSMQNRFKNNDMKLSIEALVESSLNPYATTLDRAMTARALITVLKDNMINKDDFEIRCNEYAPNFSNEQVEAILDGNMLTLDAPGCRKFELKDKNLKSQNLYKYVMSEGFDVGVPQSKNNGLEVKRTYKNKDGEEVSSASLGEVLTVNICARSIEKSQNDVVLIDLIPGGLEPEIEKPGENNDINGLIRKERREDRTIFFVNLSTEERCFSYKARAATKGSFIKPALQAEAMYLPSKNSIMAGGILEIK